MKRVSEKSPKVSIIIPVYNIEKQLAICLESALRQSYSNLEIILINDGSTDSCLEICNRYGREYQNISVIHQANKGVSAARNSGLGAARGDFITFLDSDDLLEPNAISDMVTDIVASKADVVRTMCRIYDNGKVRLERYNIVQGLYRGRELDKIIEAVVLGKISGYVFLLMIRRSAIRNTLRFDTKIHMMEDTCFYVDLVQCVNSMFLSDKVTYRYILSNTSASRSARTFKRNVNDIIAVNKRFAILLREKVPSLTKDMNAVHINVILGQLSVIAENHIGNFGIIRDSMRNLKMSADVNMLTSNMDSKYLPVYNRLLLYFAEREKLLVIAMLFWFRAAIKRFL